MESDGLVKELREGLGKRVEFKDKISGMSVGYVLSIGAVFDRSHWLMKVDMMQDRLAD